MQVVCELVLSLACLRGIARSCRQSTLVLESLALAAGSTCHRERPSHWLPLAPSQPSQVLVPVQAVGIRPSGVSYQRSNRGRNIGIPWPIVPQLYLLNERA